MKKYTSIVSIVLLFVLVLTACASEAEGTETTVAPLHTETVGVSEGLATSTPMETETDTALETMTATPEEGDTATATPSGAGEATATAVIPSTGAVDPGRLSNLLDFDVLDKSGEEISEVEDFVLSLTQSRIQYVVVDKGGFLSVGNVAAPWEAFTIQTEPTYAFVLNVDQTAFENAPDFDLDLIPSLSEPDESWDIDFRGYWDTTFTDAGITVLPTRTPEAGMTDDMGLSGSILASEFLGSTFQVGEEEAEIDDVIVDIDTGDLLYLVVLIDINDAGERAVLVPFSAHVLSWDATNESYVFDVDVDTLGTAPMFDLDAFPDTQVEGWDDEIVEFWNSFVGSRTP